MSQQSFSRTQRSSFTGTKIFRPLSGGFHSAYGRLPSLSYGISDQETEILSLQLTTPKNTQNPNYIHSARSVKLIKLNHVSLNRQIGDTGQTLKQIFTVVNGPQFSGRTISVNNQTTVLELKNELEDREGFPAKMQRLTTSGKLMTDAERVVQYNNQGANLIPIEMSVRLALAGGMPPKVKPKKERTKEEESKSDSRTEDPKHVGITGKEHMDPKKREFETRLSRVSKQLNNLKVSFTGQPREFKYITERDTPCSEKGSSEKCTNGVENTNDVCSSTNLRRDPRIT
jgi:hypothetical protein